MDFGEQFMSELQDFEYMSSMAGARADYVQGGGGNTSVKLKDEFMAIKASGYRLADVKTDDGYAVLELGKLQNFFEQTDPAALEDVEKSGADVVKSAMLSIDGLKQLRPSVEAGFHSLLEKYVLHTHCVWANLAACAQNGDKLIADALGDDIDWCMVRYVNPGAALTFEMKRVLDECAKARGRRPEVIFMQNHGLVVSAHEQADVTMLHEEVSWRMAKAFGMELSDFPAVKLGCAGDDKFFDAGNYLKPILSSGAYGAKELLEDSLYPDQMVFFRGSLELRAQGEAASAACNIYPDGSITFSCRESTALAILQTLTAVVFIRETLKKRGLSVVPMSAASQNFIQNWDAEKARKAMA